MISICLTRLAHVLACICLLTASLALAGCATSAGGDQPFNRMTITDTGFYEEGPEQNLPPSRTLYSGTRLRIEGINGEYYKVRLVSGEIGWVHTRAVGAQKEAPSWSSPATR